jgi:transposase-like protein
MMKYSLERRESVLRKLLPPLSCSVASVSEEERICTATLFNWRNAARAKGRLMPDSDKDTDAWASEDKFAVVLETSTMNESELAEYCRKKGLYAQQVNQWCEHCKSANAPPVRAQRRRDAKAQQADKKQIRQLEKELDRKEKALAETAALLVLRKKANAIWGSGEDE